MARPIQNSTTTFRISIRSARTVLTISADAVSGNGITVVKPGGVYGSTLINPDLNDWAPRLGSRTPLMTKTAIRGGFGMSYVHYTRAGSGDILAINAPNALFTSVTQPKPGTAGYRTVDQGFS